MDSRPSGLKTAYHSININDMFPLMRRDVLDPSRLEVWHTGTDTFYKVTDPTYGTPAWAQRNFRKQYQTHA